VNQIALPYRIALGALLVLAALWFTVLKPGPVEAPEPAPAAPGVTGLGNAVKGAKGAVATANAARAAGAADPTAEPASGSKAAATPASGKAAAAAKAKPAGSTGASLKTRDEAAPLLRDLSAGKVVVLAFLGRGSDDGAVRAALGELPGHGGRVVVRSASVERVGRYAGITNGAKVVGAPTVLVLGKGPKARTLTGLTTTAELDQAVGDMLARAGR
jgi:hypothetical protein